MTPPCGVHTAISTSFAGRAANSSGSSIGPREPGTGSHGCAGQPPHSSPIGRYVMETVEHREPCCRIQRAVAWMSVGAPRNGIRPLRSQGHRLRI